METWLPITGYEGVYEVSDLGRVRRIAAAPGTVPGRVLSPWLMREGYLMVTLARNGGRDKRLVHRLVAEAFLGSPPQGSETNHRDGDKTNNRLENLEWLTGEQNRDHAARIGLKPPRGERHHATRLCEPDVREIRRSYAAGATTPELARRFGMTTHGIRSIVNRRTWAHVSP